MTYIDRLADKHNIEEIRMIMTGIIQFELESLNAADDKVLQIVKIGELARQWANVERKKDKKS